jgi:hypothetical protein
MEPVTAAPLTGIGGFVPASSGNDRLRFDDERAELKALLSSSALGRAPSLCRILSYVCERYFAGGGIASIKEINIGVDALNRGPNFDPESDSIVRVEASRLRKRLLEFYRTEGADHRLQILLPDSGYIPQFVLRAESLAPASPAAGQRPAERQSKDLSWMHSLRLPKRGVILSSLAVIPLAAFFILARLWGVHTTNPASQKPMILAPAPDGDAIRLLAGQGVPKFIDSGGRVWLGDRYFQGGTAVTRPDRRIFRTLDPELYRNAREGDFSYDVPLKPGLYEVHLHFAEIVYGEGAVESSADGVRRFDIAINGRQYAHGFDIVRDAGAPNTADEVVITDVGPTRDGLLHLAFSSFVGKALLSGLEVLAGDPGRMKPVRIIAGSRQYYDLEGNLWQVDHYFLGGRVVRRATVVQNSDDPGLYTTERWGYFTYAIPVAPGSYSLRLLFSEQNFGLINFGLSPNDRAGAGNRVFDVYCNGQVLLKGLDIYKVAGGANRATERVFRDLKPNAQGKLLLSFVPTRDYAMVNAIEVVAEPHTVSRLASIPGYTR